MTPTATVVASPVEDALASYQAAVDLVSRLEAEIRAASQPLVLPEFVFPIAGEAAPDRRTEPAAYEAALKRALSEFAAQANQMRADRATLLRDLRDRLGAAQRQVPVAAQRVFDVAHRHRKQVEREWAERVADAYADVDRVLAAVAEQVLAAIAAAEGVRADARAAVTDPALFPTASGMPNLAGLRWSREQPSSAFARPPERLAGLRKLFERVGGR